MLTPSPSAIWTATLEFELIHQEDAEISKEAEDDPISDTYVPVPKDFCFLRLKGENYLPPPYFVPMSPFFGIKVIESPSCAQQTFTIPLPKERTSPGYCWIPYKSEQSLYERSRVLQEVSYDR